MKCGPLKSVCSTLLSFLFFVELSMSATMIGSGNPMINPKIHKRNVFPIRFQNT